MKNNRIFARLFAVIMAVVMCLSVTGCADISGMMDMMQGPEIEILEDGADIYSLGMFDDLPDDYSDSDPLFWVAEGENGGKVYLLGSIHIGDEQAYRIPEHIMNAFLESDALAVECDIVAAESDIMGQFELMQYYMYTDGSSIKDHVSPELYDAMVQYIEDNPSQLLTSLGYTIDTLATCKPSMWQSAFETIITEKSGLDSNLGIDRHFLMLAKSTEKDIIEVESVKFQASLFDGFSDDLFELLLWDYVSNDPDDYAEYYYESYIKWLEGDAAFFYTESETDYTGSGMSEEEIAEYEALLAEYNAALLDDRNVGMADTAEKMLERGDNVFYVVGAAHMGGRTGIVTLLRERGWKVTQLGGQDADPFTTPGTEIPSETIGFETTDDTTGDEEQDIPQSSTNGDFTLEGNLDDYYDEYLELYEHFGGTTRPATTATTTSDKDDDKETTSSTTSDNSSWNDWGKK